MAMDNIPGVNETTAIDNDGYNFYTPQRVTDHNYGGDKLQLGARTSEVRNMPTRQMDASTAAGGIIDPAQQAQFRQQQLSLGQALSDQANGIGPSVAGSQLQQSTEQNLQAALAQSASFRGGNAGAAMYAAGNARANIQQQAAMQLAQNRIQEQMAARSQLGQVLSEGRGADIGLATNQAQLGQQNNQFNAGQLQGAAGMNMQAGVAQDQFKQQQLNELLKLGYTMDQANVMLGVNQSQFASQQMNTAEAARHGIAVQNNAQAAQISGAAIGAMGAVAAAAL